MVARKSHRSARHSRRGGGDSARLRPGRDCKGAALIDCALPARKLGEGGPLDRKIETPLHDRSECNIGDGQPTKRKEAAPGEVAVENPELGNEIAALGGK